MVATPETLIQASKRLAETTPFGPHTLFVGAFRWARSEFNDAGVDISDSNLIRLAGLACKTAAQTAGGFESPFEALVALLIRHP